MGFLQQGSGRWPCEKEQLTQVGSNGQPQGTPAFGATSYLPLTLGNGLQQCTDLTPMEKLMLLSATAIQECGKSGTDNSQV